MLKAVHRLTTVRAAEGRPVAVTVPGPAHTGDLAGMLGVSPATATTMVKRLAERGLADHRPYRGVELTVSGKRAALASIRRHRIVERFLSDSLGYAWDDADRLAPTFEHEIPDEVIERMFIALHRPTTCPHGYPIPARDVADTATSGLPTPSLTGVVAGSIKESA